MYVLVETPKSSTSQEARRQNVTERRVTSCMKIAPAYVPQSKRHYFESVRRYREIVGSSRGSGWPRSSNIRNGAPWVEEKFHLFAVLTKILIPVRFFKTMLDWFEDGVVDS